MTTENWLIVTCILTVSGCGESEIRASAEGCRGREVMKSCVSLELIPLDHHATTALAVADFDGDGKDDLLSASGALLTGDGQSRMVADLHFDATPLRATGDVNGDGIADLVALHAGSLVTRLGPNLAVTSHDDLPNGGTPYAVALADLDEDGLADSIVASGDAVYVIWGGGPMITTIVADANALERIGVGAFAMHVDAADFDGDGHRDILISGTIEAWFVAGSGSRELGSLESAGQADPVRPWVLTDPNHDGVFEIYGVFPLPQVPTLEGIRALARFWRDDELYYDHSFVPLGSPELAVASGKLWTGEDEQLIVAVDADSGPELLIDCTDQELQITECGHVKLPWAPEALAVYDGLLVIADTEHGVWALQWPGGAT